MIAFLSCVLVTASIGVIFKLFPRWRVDTFNAIVVNYTLCLLLGTWLDPAVRWPFEMAVHQASWIPIAILLSILFIAGFNLAATAVQEVGMTITTLMQKMSILLTVSFALLVHEEKASALKVAGLLLALIAIFLINRPARGSLGNVRRRQLLALILVWLIAAGVEIVIFSAERSGRLGEQQMAFTTHGFGFAGLIGWMIVLFRLPGGRPLPSRQDILAGLLLGAPNFFSIYLLLYMLNQGWPASLMYPLVNITVLVASALIAVLGFRERLSPANWVGLALAIAAIGLFGWSENLAG